MVGRLIVEGLEKIKGPITRGELLSTIKESGAFDLGGITLSYGRHGNQGMDKVFFTVIQAGGSLRPIDRLER